MTLPSFTLKGKTVKYPIIQGGMGIGYSNYLLAGSVAREGGLGVIASVALDRIVGSRLNKKFDARSAAAREVQDAKSISGDGLIGMNIMVAIENQYESSVLGSLDAEVDVIISGAGLPIKLPAIVKTHPRGDQVALVPIVSSKRALEIIIRKWKKYDRLPDAVVVEGPLAGGHLGWLNTKDIHSEGNKLENLVAEVLEVAAVLGIPVIAAGGIHDRGDIQKYLDLGCSAVQMGTRFLATHESGANKEYKENLINCKEGDIHLAHTPGSPCKLLFRVIKSSPFYVEILEKRRPPKCDKGYLLRRGECAAKTSIGSMCICNGLIASSDVKTSEQALYTIGARAHEIEKIVSVKELMQEIIGPNI